MAYRKIFLAENSVGDRNLYWKVRFGCRGGRTSISELYTCDGSYDCLNFSDYKHDGLDGEVVDRIKYFGKTSSTDLLKKIHSEGKKLDLILSMGGFLQKTVSYLVK